MSGKDALDKVDRAMFFLSEIEVTLLTLINERLRALDDGHHGRDLSWWNAADWERRCESELETVEAQVSELRKLAHPIIAAAATERLGWFKLPDLEKAIAELAGKEPRHIANSHGLDFRHVSPAMEQLKELRIRLWSSIPPGERLVELLKQFERTEYRWNVDIGFKPEIHAGEVPEGLEAAAEAERKAAWADCRRRVDKSREEVMRIEEMIRPVANELLDAAAMRGVISGVEGITLFLESLDNPRLMNRIPQQLVLKVQAEAGQLARAMKQSGTPSAPPAIPPPPVCTNDDLSQRQREILVAMLELEAIDSDLRATTEKIAKQAAPGVDAAGFKDPVADLAAKGFIGTKAHRGGGCWLLEKGIARAKSIQNGQGNGRF